MKFQTETGSIYEVDENSKRIRRISGIASPTHRQSKDNDWKSYNYISPIVIGKSAIIMWCDGTPLLPGSEGVIPATITSFIIKIE